MLTLIPVDPTPSATPGDDFRLTPAQLTVLRRQFLRCLAAGYGPDDFLRIVAEAGKDAGIAKEDDDPVRVRVVQAAKKIVSWKPSLRVVTG